MDIPVEADVSVQAQFRREPLARGPMASVAENGAFIVGPDFCQGVEEHIHAFASDKLTCKQDKVPLAEGTRHCFVSLDSDRNAQMNLLSLKSVAHQLLLEVVRVDHQSMTAFVELNLAPFIRIADPFEWKASLMVTGH